MQKDFHTAPDNGATSPRIPRRAIPGGRAFLLLWGMALGLVAQTPPWEPASEKAMADSRADQIPVLLHQAATTNRLSPILATEALRRVWDEVGVRLLVVAPDLTNTLGRDSLERMGIPPAVPFAVVYPDNRPPRVLPVELNQGQLIAALRDAHAAALALRQPAAPPTPPSAFTLDPALMRRYGLVPAPSKPSPPRAPRWENADDATLARALRRGQPVLIHWSDRTSGLPAVFTTPVASAALADFPGERLVLRPHVSPDRMLALLSSIGATNPPCTVVVQPDGKPWRTLGADITQSALLAALNSAATLARTPASDPANSPSTVSPASRPTNGISSESLRRLQLHVPAP